MNFKNEKEMIDNLTKKAKRIKELQENNIYDNKIVNFYNEGILIIKNKEIKIDRINVVTDQNNNQFIDIVDDLFILKEGIKIKKVTSFRNTSLFKDFIDKYTNNIEENKITINDEMLKEFLSQKWDGNYHTLTPETAFLNENKNSD